MILFSKAFPNNSLTISLNVWFGSREVRKSSILKQYRYREKLSSESSLAEGGFRQNPS
jgi:hypothetical protein